jgi:hypothetical protein
MMRSSIVNYGKAVSTSSANQPTRHVVFLSLLTGLSFLRIGLKLLLNKIENIIADDRFVSVSYKNLIPFTAINLVRK